MNPDCEIQPDRPVERQKPRLEHPFAELLALLACALALAFAADIGVLLIAAKGAEHRDFTSYWAAGKQLAQHRDPYDAAAILSLERSVGSPPQGQALIVRNPPFVLPLVAPLGYVDFPASSRIWSILLLLCWTVSIRMLWRMQNPPGTFFRVFGYPFSPVFVVALFPPALACIFYGQTGIFALLGVVLFLRHHPSRPFMAGFSLWFCALKPHLFLPFAIVLLLWIAVTRSYRLLAGLMVSLGASGLLAYLLDPLAWQQYAHMMRTVGIDREFIPCLGIALRFAISPSSTWLQYVPAALGCLWTAAYYWSHRYIWDWRQHGPLLVLVSVLVSPYSWLTDEALVVPALLLAAYRTSFRSLLALLLLSSAIYVAAACSLSMHSIFYLWTAPAWLAWYLVAFREVNHPQPVAISA